VNNISNNVKGQWYLRVNDIGINIVLSGIGNSDSIIFDLILLKGHRLFRVNIIFQILLKGQWYLNVDDI
jgi:hypothetical protein